MRRAAVAALLVLLASACAAEPGPGDAERSPATTATTARAPEAPGEVAGEAGGVDDVGDVVLVGDSVLVLAEDELRRDLDARLHVDAVPCRELADEVTTCGGTPAPAPIASGLDALRATMSSLAAERVVPSQVVLVLANNATLDESDLDAAMALTGPAERVWWVNARIERSGRQDVNNRLLASLAARDERAEVIDWFGASESRDLLYDSVHPDDEGQAVLAALIARHVRCGCTP